MAKQKESIKKPCKLFKLLQNDVPDYCDKYFIPRVEWQKFCSNKNKCHDKYWKIIHQERELVNERLEKLEEKVGV